LNYWEINF